MLRKEKQGVKDELLRVEAEKLKIDKELFEKKEEIVELRKKEKQLSDDLKKNMEALASVEKEKGVADNKE